LQRACACGQHNSAGGECEECKQKRTGTLQRVAISPSPVHEIPPIVHEVLRSPGQPLDAATRAFMEPRFGYDFSRVRVHTDTQAAESARAVNALAYTVGRDVVFGVGQYAPLTSQGQMLLAHELTHTIQQRSDLHQLPEQLNVTHAGEAAEQEAASAAEVLMQGRSFAPARKDLPRLARQQTPGNENPPANGPAAAREGSGGEATKGEGDSKTIPAETFTGVCIRTPLGPGQVRFNGCAPEQLSDYAVMPENGTTLTTPVNGTSYDSDGFWFRHHRPRTEWFKVGNHCDLDVTCEGNDFSYSWCCNAAASLFKGTPGWTRDSHGTTNPF
jgi:hypothetical protein